MSRYIDVDMYIEYLTELKQSAKKHYRLNEALQLQNMIEQVESFPTADVQEVVRCKDCKSYNKHYGECTLFGAHLGENGFCSEGAKMDKSDMEHIL